MNRNKNETAAEFIERAMSSKEVRELYPDVHERLDFCISQSKSLEGLTLASKLEDELVYSETYAFLYDDYEEAEAAEYQGKKVTLNKPFRTSNGPKKFAVYTKNEKGNVVIVRFGDPNMTIKKNDPERRKSFRARHKCDTDPAEKWTPRYWSCRMW